MADRGSRFEALGGALFTLLISLFIGGCAATLPAPLDLAVPDDPGLGVVLSDPGAFRGLRVRWGGQIVGVENTLEHTDLQIVQRRLERSGRPADEDQSAGRFIARIPGFVDPAVYAPDRELTVVGPLGEPKGGLVGSFHYTFPVVLVEAEHLWPKRETLVPYAYPAYPHYPWRGPYYDPFYDPWYW
jgi:outer membrane lipoprotein